MVKAYLEDDLTIKIIIHGMDMELFRLRDKEVYVEEDEPLTDPPSELDRPVFVCTRSLWNTGVYGQIETCGWISKDKLIPLDPSKKKDQKIISQIESVIEKAKQRSQIWLDIAKAKGINTGV